MEFAGVTVAAGDTIMVRASAGNAASYPTSLLDFNPGSYHVPTSGTAAGGKVKWIGYNGMPTIACPGLTFYQSALQHFENLYLVGTGTGNGSLGIINGVDVDILNCIVNLNLQATTRGVSVTNSTIRGTEFYGGSTSPTSSAGADGIIFGSYTGLIHGCTIRYCRGHGVEIGVGCNIRDCKIYGNVGNGIELAAPGTIAMAYIVGNTINDNEGHGIRITGSNGAVYTTIRNNNITNHTVSAKYGISCATSSSDKRKRDWGFNNVWNNTGNYENVTADATDLSIDPDYADAANGDFTVQEATLLGAAFPTGF